MAIFLGELASTQAKIQVIIYYHLSPHIRAHVLCALPRTRYVFLTGLEPNCRLEWIRARHLDVDHVDQLEGNDFVAFLIAIR